MNDSDKDEGIELLALSGDNPLGFLASLGVVVALHQTGRKGIRLSWNRNVSWTPSLHGFDGDKAALVKKLADALKGRTVPDKSKSERASAQKKFDQAKKVLKAKIDEIRKRKLKGKERELAREEEIEPLEKVGDKLRVDWLAKLKETVSSPELALGDSIDCTETEYRSFAKEFLNEADEENCFSVDMLSAFGSDAAVSKGRIKSTPFCFSSARQKFLTTVRELSKKVTEDKIRKTLFNQWTYSDKGLSTRWDPSEVRRYAYRATDPSPEGAKTVWMANLLAYRALTLFPSAPVKGQLKTTGWSRWKESKKKRNVFTWPIWDKPIGVETIRSLLQHLELAKESPSLEKLMPLGVCKGFRSERIQVDKYFGFSPASPV